MGLLFSERIWKNMEIDCFGEGNHDFCMSNLCVWFAFPEEIKVFVTFAF
jgi:hypothetical protein